MTKDSDRDGHSGRQSLATGLSGWRFLEVAAAIGLLFWLFGSTAKPERATPADVNSRQVAIAPLKHTQQPGSGFTDNRALVPATGVQQPPPPKSQPAPVVAAIPAPAAARAVEPVAKAPVADMPAPTTRSANLAANIPPPPSAAALPVKLDASCPPPEIYVSPLIGGQTQISIQSPCRRGQDVGFVYDGIEIRRQLPASGTGVFALDLFAGDRRSVDVAFADGTRRVIPVTAADLDKVSKIAVRWRAPVNLDLHVFEHAAGAGQPGHVWPGATTSPEAAHKTRAASGLGRGFLTVYDDGQGDKVEVYTYFHGEKDQGGTVAMALDHETRGSLPSEATCGQGPLAKVEFAVSMLSPKGEIARAAGNFKPARCNQPLAAADRFDYALMPTITIRN